MEDKSKSIEWDGNAYMGFDMIFPNIITSLITIWLMKKLYILQTAIFKKEDSAKGFCLWRTIACISDDIICL